MIAKFRKIIGKIPSWSLIIGGIVSFPFYESISLLCFVFIAVKLLINKKQWSNHFKSSLFKTIIVMIIIERILTPLVGTWYWEYSRGGAKFHFEDFWASKQMFQYFKKRYREGSDARILVYDIETAGGQCDALVEFKEEKKTKYTQEIKDRYGLEDFRYSSYFSCKKKSSITRFLATYYVDVFLSENKKIIKVIAYIDPLYI